MKGELSEQAKSKIMDICSTEVCFCKMIKKLELVFPLVWIAIFMFIYFGIKYGSIWIYLRIAIVVAIVEIIMTKNLTCFWDKIEKNECFCFESVLLGNRIKIPRGNHGRVKYYYVTTKIDGESKEIEYKGQSFDNIVIGEKILVISYNNLFGKEKFICFLDKEINE